MDASGNAVSCFLDRRLAEGRGGATMPDDPDTAA